MNTTKFKQGCKRGIALTSALTLASIMYVNGTQVAFATEDSQPSVTQTQTTNDDVAKAEQAKNDAANQLEQELKKAETAKNKAVDNLAQQTEQAYSDAQAADKAVNQAETQKAQAKAEVEKATTELNQSKESLDKAQANWDNTDKTGLEDAENKVADAKKAETDAQATHNNAVKQSNEAKAKVSTDAKKAQSAKDTEVKAKATKDKAQKTVDDTQAAFDEANDYYEYLKANNNDKELIAKAQKDVDDAKIALDDAKEALNSANTVVTSTKTDLDKAVAKESTATKKVDAAKTQLEESNKELSAINDKLDQAIATKNALEAKVDSTDADIVKAQQRIDDARQAKINAQNRVNDIEAKLSQAQNDLANAQEKFNQGARGFFTAMGADKALIDLDKGLEMGLYQPGDDLDAVSLDNMKESLKALRDMNIHRQRENDEEGTNLQPLKVSHLLMARSQMHADGSRNQWLETLDIKDATHWYKKSFSPLHLNNPVLTNAPHAGENLGWLTHRDSYDHDMTENELNGAYNWQMMYDIEKACSKGEISGGFCDDPHMSEAGHYKNIVGNFNTMGAAISCYDESNPSVWQPPYPETRCFLITRSYNLVDTSKTYTVDEYEKMFMDYYTSVSPAEIKKKVNDLNRILDQANADVVRAQSDIDIANNDYDAAIAKRSTLQTDLNSATNTVNNLTTKKNDATNNVTSKQNDLDTANDDLETAKNNVNSATVLHNKAKTDRDDAQNAMSAKEKALYDKQARLDELSSKDAVGDAKAKADELAKDLANAKANLSNDTALFEEAKAARMEADRILHESVADSQTKDTKAQSALDDYNKAKKNHTKAQKDFDDTFGALSDLKKAQSNHQTSTDKLAQAQKDYNLADNQFVLAVDKANQLRETYELFASIDADEALKYGITSEDERLQVAANYFALYHEAMVDVNAARAALNAATDAYDQAKADAEKNMNAKPVKPHDKNDGKTDVVTKPNTPVKPTIPTVKPNEPSTNDKPGADKPGADSSHEDTNTDNNVTVNTELTDTQHTSFHIDSTLDKKGKLGDTKLKYRSARPRPTPPIIDIDKDDNVRDDNQKVEQPGQKVEPKESKEQNDFSQTQTGSATKTAIIIAAILGLGGVATTFVGYKRRKKDKDDNVDSLD